MSTLIERLKAGRTAQRTVTLNGVALGLRVLSEQDALEADIATQEAMRERGIELGLASAETFEAEKTSQLLLRALVDPDTGKPVFASARALRETLLRDDKAYLVEEYMAHERAYAPSEANLSPEAFAVLLEALKKTPETTDLNDSSTATLKKLVRCLVSPPAN